MCVCTCACVKQIKIYSRCWTILYSQYQISIHHSVCLSVCVYVHAERFVDRRLATLSQRSSTKMPPESFLQGLHKKKGVPIALRESIKCSYLRDCVRTNFSCCDSLYQHSVCVWCVCLCVMFVCVNLCLLCDITYILTGIVWGLTSAAVTLSIETLCMCGCKFVCYVCLCKFVFVLWICVCVCVCVCVQCMCCVNCVFMFVYMFIFVNLCMFVCILCLCVFLCLCMYLVNVYACKLFECVFVILSLCLMYICLCPWYLS